MLLSALYLPPAVWMAVVAAAVMPFAGQRPLVAFQFLARCLGVILLGATVAGRG